MLTDDEIDAIFDAHKDAPTMSFRYLCARAVESAVLERLVPVAWASSKEWRANQLMSTAQYNSALPKNRVDFDVPLYAKPRDIDSEGK